jgi:thioredoxin-related protein
MDTQGQMVAFADLTRLQAIEKRPVIVFIHTSWCRYCSAMQNSLRNNKSLSELINRKFYLVMLDGEEKNSIRFASRDFHFKPTGKDTGTHELATQLGSVDGHLSYPSICLLNEKNEIIYQRAGFLDPASILSILRAVSKK